MALPYLVEHIEMHAREEEPGSGPGFEFGLDLSLDGLEEVRGARG